jgi:ribosomal protein S18 acetylase RimI-like enzyme
MESPILQEHIALAGNWQLKRALPEDFALYSVLYGDGNLNPYSMRIWDERVLDRLPECQKGQGYWICRGEERAGGVILTPNRVSRYFLVPQYERKVWILEQIVRVLQHFSDPTSAIRAYGVLPIQLEDFQRVGFLPLITKRVMLRPSEAFAVEWDDELRFEEPSEERAEEIADLVQASFHASATRPLEEAGEGHPYDRAHYEEEVRLFFSGEDNAPELSSLLFERSTGRLVGVCLVEIWDGWPLIIDIEVDPNWRGRGLATRMIQRTLHESYGRYPVVRLFVTVGNPAESLYIRLGFLPGVALTRMELTGAA